MNKKIILAAVGAASLGSSLGAAEVEVKGNVLIGGNLFEHVIKDSEIGEEVNQFGGAYLCGDFQLSNEYITSAGKIYYRVGSIEYEKFSDIQQKLELKKAFIKFRPLGNDFLEFSAGKLYSYYLSGNFFQLAEIYTGSSRWGKTGFGIKIEENGFTVGLGLPLTESYAAFNSAFDLNGSLSYDFSKAYEVPVKLGAAVGFSKKENNFIWAQTYSVNYLPNLKGFVSKPSLTVSASLNSEPYVASSVFKNIVNYKTVGKADFVSLNFHSRIGITQVIVEGEIGKSRKVEIVPLYCAFQVTVPVAKVLELKPKFSCFGAVDVQNENNSRYTFEIYPKASVKAGSWKLNAAADIYLKQINNGTWKCEYSFPLYAEFKSAININ